MNGDDDKLLQELGRAVRTTERNADAQREERLSSHSLEPDELAEMQARAERDAELARALDAHAPLGAEVKKRISAELVAVAQRQSATPEEAAAPGRVVALPPRIAHARRLAWLVLPLSAAAAALLWLAGSKVAPIPAYDLQISGARAETRSGPETIDASHAAGSTLRVGADTRLRVLLRPATAVTGEVAARVYLARGPELTEWPAQSQPAESGALQLMLGAPPGTVASAEARIVVGRPELLAKHAAALARGSDTHGQGYQVWRVRLAGD